MRAGSDRRRAASGLDVDEHNEQVRGDSHLLFCFCGRKDKGRPIRRFEVMLRYKALIPYWIVIEMPSGFMYECGVTAYNKADALRLLKNDVFPDAELPEIKEIIEDVDVRTLDEKHVQRNMRPHVFRGVWYLAFRIRAG